MRIKNFLFITLCAFFFSLHLQAQEIKVDFDLKVIYTDSLNLPDNSTSKYVITILPDLLERPGESLITEYDIQIDGLSVGSAVDGVLTQLRISEIEKIEVSNSPLSSYYNNGRSGSINFILRKKPASKKSTWGSVSSDFAFPFDILPKFTIGYEDPKFSVRGLVFCDIYNATDETDNYHYVNSTLAYEETTKTKNKFFSDLARVYMTYKPTAKDQFQLNFSQVTTRDKTTTENTANPYIDEENDKNTILRTHFKYEHDFSQRSKFTGELQFVYNPQTIDYISTEQRNKIIDHNLAGMMEFETKLLPLTNKNFSNLILGLNFNNSFIRNHCSSDLDKTYNRQYAPYIISKSAFGPIRIKAQAELQFYHYDFFMHQGNPYNKFVADLAGKIMAEYQFTPRKSLRLILDRKFDRPTTYQLYPYEYHNMINHNEFIGNPDLNNVLTNEATLEWLSSRRWGKNTLFLNAGTSYLHVSDIINVQPVNDKSHTNFCNNGKNDIINVDLMARYTYDLFSISATANFFHNKTNIDKEKDHYDYFNIALQPSYTTSNGWQASLRLLYNSEVKTKSSTLGDNCSASFNIGKTWGNLNIHGFGRWAISGKTRDIKYNSSENQRLRNVTEYYLSKNAIGLGFEYKF